MKITHTANAGIIIEAREGTIAFDALHSEERPPFCAVPEQTLINIAKNCAIDALVFTHPHPDHYNESWTRYYLHHHASRVVMPAGPLATDPLTEHSGEIDLGFTVLKYARITHDGAQYANVPNYAFCFELEDRQIMLLGDGSLDAPELPFFCAGKRPDLAFLNFPFVTLSRGRDRIREDIRPDALAIYHLPFRKNDRFHFIDAVQKRAAMPGMPDTLAILTECMQTVEY